MPYANLSNLTGHFSYSISLMKHISSSSWAFIIKLFHSPLLFLSTIFPATLSRCPLLCLTTNLAVSIVQYSLLFVLRTFPLLLFTTLPHFPCHPLPWSTTVPNNLLPAHPLSLSTFPVTFSHYRTHLRIHDFSSITLHYSLPSRPNYSASPLLSIFQCLISHWTFSPCQNHLFFLP